MFYGQIEGTELVVLDKRFKPLFAGYARVERLWTGARWSEGPAWFGPGRYLIWSDIPNNRMLRYAEPSGEVSVFRAPSNNSNGNTVDNQGRLVTCEHLTRRVTRTEVDGSISVVADKWQGKRLNSPNDVVVKSDDSIWFTDPAYGIDGDNEGDRATPEIDGCHVYRVDPQERRGRRGSSTTWSARTALRFRPTRSCSTSPTPARPTLRTGRATSAASQSPRTAEASRATASSPNRPPDCSTAFASTGKGAFGRARREGVHCFEPDGTLIGKILIPEIVANVTFGGAKRNRLFICGTTSLYAVLLMTNGSKLG